MSQVTPVCGCGRKILVRSRAARAFKGHKPLARAGHDMCEQCWRDMQNSRRAKSGWVPRKQRLLAAALVLFGGLFTYDYPQVWIQRRDGSVYGLWANPNPADDVEMEPGTITNPWQEQEDFNIHTPGWDDDDDG